MTAEEKAKSRWRTQSGSGVRPPDYNRRKFYTHSTNEHNHGETIRQFSPANAREMGLPDTTKLPPEFVARIKYLVSSPKTAYRSVQDFIRDAIYHRLHDVEELHEDGTFMPFFDEELFLLGLEQHEMENQAFETIMERYGERVKRYEQERNPHGIADLIETARQRTPLLRHRMTYLRQIAEWEKIQERIELL